MTSNSRVRELQQEIADIKSLNDRYTGGAQSNVFTRKANENRRTRLREIQAELRAMMTTRGNNYSSRTAREITS